ncbi:hypothetical protein IDM40_08365 [Nocardiopsis sp. HNM0947]|uniref:Uncharacterized protein n=1 Tax=Nocardiopsis coralli TaxID=2772213 RepID=A0ABR9P4G8_9ACTN|nr:helix-turn-helix domain-containing protein [Nocardiopsis coralli]MBE2998714.1 hypothetical protein [Nocardiopsis coralli]
MGKKNRPERPDQDAPVTAEQIQRTVQDAKTLASIPDQKLLEDPALNPATRQRYDQLTAARLQATLDLEHRRKLREAEEADRREADQAEVERVIASARQATSPARTILTMTRHQSRFGRITLTASLLLSIGSAVGLAALVAQHGGPEPVGYLAEIGLTGLSTTVIVWRGILARAGTVIDQSTSRLFLTLMVVPLLISVIGSTLGAGPVGAACSVGSALFAGLTYLINTSASDAIKQSITKIDRSDGPTEHPPEPDAHTGPDRASTPDRTATGDGLGVVADALADEAADYLRSHESPSERSHEHGRSHGQDEPSTVPQNGQVGASERPWEQDRSHGPDQGPLTAQERRRLEGLQNRKRVANFLYERPDATAAEIADALGLGESTVRRIRKELDTGGA